MNDIEQTKWGPSKPRSCHPVDSCANCYWRLVYFKFDDVGACTYGLPLPRPMTPDEFYEFPEFITGANQELTHAHHNRWHNWVGGIRDTYAPMICDHHWKIPNKT
jgi:hypothetical protein